jgi:hypothetical protein
VKTIDEAAEEAVSNGLSASAKARAKLEAIKARRRHAQVEDDDDEDCEKDKVDPLINELMGDIEHSLMTNGSGVDTDRLRGDYTVATLNTVARHFQRLGAALLSEGGRIEEVATEFSLVFLDTFG